MPVALGIACAQCQVAYGAHWYFDPQRWTTVDGYVPFAILWDAWRALQSVQAAHRLSDIRASVMAQPRDPKQLPTWQRAMDEELKLAYPPEGRANGHP